MDGLDIHWSAYQGDVLALECLLFGPEEANARDGDGATPLHHAVHENKIEAIQYLIKMKADVTLQDSQGRTPLHVAAYRGNEEALQILLRVVSDPNFVNCADAEGCIALHESAVHGHANVTSILLAAGANPNHANHQGDTPLHLAAETGKDLCLRSLIAAGGRVDARNKLDETPLHRAAFTFPSTVEILLSAGSNANVRDTSGATPLHNAVSSGNVSCAELLVTKGNASVDCVDASGVTPLQQAIYGGHLESACQLLNFGAKVDVRDTTGANLVHTACYKGALEILKVLLEAAAHSPSSTLLSDLINAQDLAGATPLHKAAYYGQLKCATLLMDKGCTSLDTTDQEGATPLHKAAFNGHLETVKYFLEKKMSTSLEARDREGASPLHKAAFRGADQVVDFLLRKGARGDVIDNGGRTPLHYAAFRGHNGCVRMLLAAGGVAPNVADARGVTPLHVAAACGRFSAAKLLLEKGADVAARDASGRTPLFLAVRNGHANVVRLLIEKGAELELCDNTTQAGANSSDPMFAGEHSLKPDTVMRLFREVREGTGAEQAEQFAVDKGKEQLFLRGVQLFNSKPRRGIEFLEKCGILDGTPEHTARFLHLTPTLNRTRLGELLGDDDATARSLLAAYVEYFDFSGMPFDAALRKFLAKFRLPGEAQKIDRVMQAFAARFFFLNHTAGIFASADAVYVLAFSVIMLNTDAHNPAIKNKMTLEAFVRNNSKINEGADLPREFLESLYKNIIEHEIKMDAPDGVSAMWTNAEKEGHLTKQGGRIKTWKRRYFILKDNNLFYFKNKGDAEPCGIIPLEDLVVTKREAKGSGNKRYTFILTPKDGEKKAIKSMKMAEKGAVQGHHDHYIIAASTEQELDEWVAAINNNIHRNPFYNLLKTALARHDKGSQKVPSSPVSSSTKH